MLKKISSYIKIGVVCMLITISCVGISQDVKVNASDNVEYIPQINGKMIYHTYSDYNERDSKLYIFDFKTKENICISDKFKDVYHAMNADFSANGSEIIFMGIVDNKGTEEWDIFRYNIETNKLEDLTKGNKLKDEDPKYSPDGTKIIFKQGHWDNVIDKMIYDIVEMDLETGKMVFVTNDIYEDSMPYYSSDGKSVYYTKVIDKSTQIYKTSLDLTRKTTKIYEEKGIRCYYPIIYKDTLYFSKWFSEYNESDNIQKLDLNTNKLINLTFNSEDYNCSDVCPISDEYAIISSTKPGGKGGYDLYIADNITGKTWSLDLLDGEINDNRHQLGAAYFVAEE